MTWRHLEVILCVIVIVAQWIDADLIIVFLQRRQILAPPRPYIPDLHLQRQCNNTWFGAWRQWWYQRRLPVRAPMRTHCLAAHSRVRYVCLKHMDESISHSSLVLVPRRRIFFLFTWNAKSVLCSNTITIHLGCKISYRLDPFNWYLMNKMESAVWSWVKLKANF